nr:hypothetical protein [Tanacetum cinerariifolium]
MFQAKESKERLDVVKSLIACKPKPEASICAFVLEMKGNFDRLESLNMVFDAKLSINIILYGLPTDYNQFVLSYQMNGKETSIMKLHNLLQTVEQVIKKIDVPFTSATHVFPVGHNARKRKTSHSNWKGKAAKGKSDRGSRRKAESEIAPTSDPNCFYCNTKGHWKSSCPKYLKDPKDGKVKKGSHSGMFMIELQNTTTSDSWVLDTGCGTHICTVLQGLNESRRLKHGELNLVMGNKKIMHMTRIGEYEIMLKSRVRIDLNNCCYSSEMTRNIISFHALFKDGYKFLFDNTNGDILDESMDVGDDVNDKLSFAAKVIESMVLIVYLGVWKWVKTGCLVNLMFNEVSSSESKVLGQSFFPAYVSAGSGSDGLIWHIYRNVYGVLKV